MKKTIAYCIAILLFFAACKKKNNVDLGGGHVNVPDSSFISATINNEQWETDSATVFSVSTKDSGIYNLMINAVKTTDANTAMNLYITNYTGPATYNISPPFVSATYIKGNQRYYAGSGQIDITEDSTYIAGTYSFTADSITVTNGSFYIAR